MRRFPLILLLLVGIALVAKIEFATAGTVGDASARRGWMRARQDLDDGLQSIDDGDDDGDAVLSVSPPATSAPAKRVRLAAVLGGNAPMAVQEQVVDDQQKELIDDQQKELIDDQHRERIDDQKQHQIDQHRRIVAEAFTWLTLRLHALRAHCPRRIMRSFDPKEVSESRELHLNAFAESYFRDKVQLAECIHELSLTLNGNYLQSVWLHVDNVNVPLSLDRIRHLASHFPSVVFSFSRRDWLNSAERINAVLTELDSQLSWYAVNVPFSEGITENTSSRTDNIKTEDLLLTTQRLHDITWTASYRRMHNPDLAQARRIPLPATIYKGKVDVNFVMPLDLNAVELDNEQPISVAQPVFAAERFSPSPSPVHSYGRVVPDAHLLTTSAAYFRSSPVPTIPRVDSTASGHMLRVASTDDASQLGIMGTQSSDTPALWEQRPFFRLCHRSARHVSACRHIVFQLFPGIWTHHTSRATEFVREVQTFALHHPQLDRVIDAVTKDDNDDAVVAVALVPKMQFALPPQVWVRDFYLGHPTIFRLLRVEHDLGISPQVHYILHDLMSNGYTCCACGDAANGFETFPFRFDRDRGGLEWVRRTYMATNMAKRVFPNSALEFTLTLNSANCLADD